MSAQDDLVKQILGQGLTSKWTGSGFGSAEANAADMARILADIGITDIKQFGKIPKYEPAFKVGETYNGEKVVDGSVWGGSRDGKKYIVRDTGRIGDEMEAITELVEVPKDAKLETIYGMYHGPNQESFSTVDPSRVETINGKLLADTGEKVFGNKVTGQEVSSTYGDRQNGNFFGGTYEGKGNTGYGVKFDDQGNPVFYTQGASSSDLGQIAPLLTIASLVPGLQPFAMAANAAIAAKQGNPLGLITSLAGMGDLAGISGMADVANAAKFAGALKSGDPLAIAMAGANAGGISDIGGVDLKDISKGIGAVKAIESGDPLAMLRYGMGALPKSDGLTSSIGPGNMDEFRENLIPGYFQPGGEGYIAKEVTNPLGPTEEFNPAETDWSSFYNTGLSPEEIAKRETLMASLPGQEMQIDPKNWESYNQNLIDIINNRGGYTSQWQTVGSDRIMINDDGTGIGTNENGDSYALNENEVNSMIENGMLNTAASGYVAATGGTGDRPGGSGPAPTAPKTPAGPKPTAPTRPGTTPGTATQPTAQQIAVREMAPELLGMPQLGNVFYYGKDFSSQKQELDPSGRLVQQEYDPLSVTQAGPELELDKMAGSNENDVQALIQQIMANSGGNISPEELAQILGQQGASYG
jgi:hypothetical protein